MRQMSEYHVSVLLQETIDGLGIIKGGRYIDATLGGGGHTREILKRGGYVLGIDADEQALMFVSDLLGNEIQTGQLTLVRGNFKNIDNLAMQKGFIDVDGIVYDLGISSHQVDTPERGFSFSKEGPLDMRMDEALSVKASDLVNGLHKGELTELFERLGEEPFAKRIAENIVKEREKKPIETTGELAGIVEHSYPRGVGKIHPATKVFQALRIAVNDELNNLRDSLPKSVGLLKKGGKLAIISFHSLEDRIVKDYLRSLEELGTGRVITKKPVEAGEMEVAGNKRARSAKLRFFEKIWNG